MSTPPATYDDLSAVFINCTLTRSPGRSHTQALLDRAATVMTTAGASVHHIRAVDHAIAEGVYLDMTEHGWDRDDWPAIQQHVMAADILVIGTPIWLSQKSSVATKVVERLYGYSGEYNDRGQYAYYGRVGGVLVTGNEDGVKHCSMDLLYGLQHLGYTIPPQADSAWMGEAGPGPSYADPGAGGPENEFTQRNTVFAAWNLMHVAALLKRAGGIPAHGNQRAAWDAGADFDHPNPEYR